MVSGIKNKKKELKMLLRHLVTNYLILWSTYLNYIYTVNDRV